MINLQKEKEFFSEISNSVFNLLSSLEQGVLTIKQKGKNISDISTSSDIAVENLLSKEVNRLFPADKILGEESSLNSTIDPNVRTWIIDPICGTENYARGIRNFCTNISLSYQNAIIAACVLDHARKEFVWSIGKKKIYVNNVLVEKTNLATPYIDVDLGGAYKEGKEAKEKHMNFIYKLLTETSYIPTSLNTSLGFAYTAIGRFDGYFTSTPHVWDVAAANFLLVQSGGIVSDIFGNPWNLNSKNVLGARNDVIHKKLLDLYLNS